MKTNPEVSAIIIFLNAEDFLTEAIESVLNQTYSNYELILVDDGSTDKSSIIAQGYENKFPETIKYLFHIDHANLGMSATRNLGISHATGEYIAFLDADDTWPATRLQKMVGIYQENSQLGMVFGRINFFSNDPNFSKFIGLSKIKLPVNQVLFPPKVFEQTFAHGGGMLTTFGNILIKKEVLISVEGFENDFKGQGDDVVVWSKVNLKYPAYLLDECTLNYRRHKNASGMIDQKKGALIDGRLRVTEWVYDYVLKLDKETKEWALPIIKEAVFYAVIKSYTQKSSKLPGALKKIDRSQKIIKALFFVRAKFPGAFSTKEIFSLLQRR